MMHEIGVELQQELRAKGAPFVVLDREDSPATATFARERIVIAHDEGGDRFATVRSQRANPKHVVTRTIGGRLEIYAKSPKAGALMFEHRRRAEHVLDLVLVALDKIASRRRNAWTPTAGRFFVPPDLADSERGAGAAYELTFTWDRGVYEQKWTGEIAPTAAVGPDGVSIKSSTTIGGSEDCGCGDSGDALLTSLPHGGLWIDYVGAPWASTPTVGGTSSTDRTLHGSPAPDADALNGYGVAVFDGSTSIGTGSIPASAFIGAEALSAWLLVRVDQNAAASLLVDADEYVGLYVEGSDSDPTVTLSVWSSDAEDYVSTPAVSVAAEQWALIQARHDGERLWCRVNGGSWASVEGVAIEDLSSALVVGTDLVGAIAAVGVAPVAWTDTQFDLLRSAVRARWGTDV